jgi:hypothetical protein
MALVYGTASVTPTKLELLTTWLPTRPWFSGDPDLRQVASYRFDDPAGEVGLEGILVRAGDGPVVHVPLTYRAAPLAGAGEHLVGTLEHSVLGRRWVYDAAGDPVWATVLVTAVLTGGVQAEQIVDQGGRRERREPTAIVQGSGTPETPVAEIGPVTSRDEGPTTVVRADPWELIIVRAIGVGVPGATQTLTGHWAGSGPAVLAGVRPVGS